MGLTTDIECMGDEIRKGTLVPVALDDEVVVMVILITDDDEL